MAKRLGQLKLPYEVLKSAFEDNMDDIQAFHECLREAGKLGVTKSGVTFENEPPFFR